ncbi:hypothetical protein GJ744_004440 [Endocarpon pusillum]|uniref:Uncharacterized protein n=1 Tax=Endocarpon pusillum TaxID=364733 RepID=A0A8H7AZS4_9EURO|nr:hypothetical protein GJ744_004440 [Endocarpon pusillum]
MLISLFTLFLFSWTTVQTVLLTGNQYIAAFNSGSFTYLSLTALTTMLPSSPGSRDAQSLVDKYTGFIEAQLEEDPQPANKFSQVEQYGVASGDHSFILEDARFLNALVLKKGSFTKSQKKVLSDYVSRQINFIAPTLNTSEKYFPDVTDIFKSDLDSLVEVIKSTANELLS